MYTQDKLMVAHMTPQIQKPYTTLLWNVADLVR